MQKTDPIFFLAGGLVLYMFVSKSSYQNKLASFLATWESFSASPYWDVNRWSWGYGTEVPGSTRNQSINPGGTITKDAAFDAMKDHFNSDYNYLKELIFVDLNANQWAALLSFAYNCGRYNADNLVSNINAQDWPALEHQWNLYIYAGGVINQNLIARRAAEWELFTS